MADRTEVRLRMIPGRGAVPEDSDRLRHPVIRVPNYDPKVSFFGYGEDEFESARDGGVVWFWH